MAWLKVSSSLWLCKWHRLSEWEENEDNEHAHAF